MINLWCSWCWRRISNTQMLRFKNLLLMLSDRTVGLTSKTQPHWTRIHRPLRKLWTYSISFHRKIPLKLVASTWLLESCPTRSSKTKSLVLQTSCLAHFSRTVCLRTRKLTMQKAENKLSSHSAKLPSVSVLKMSKLASSSPSSTPFTRLCMTTPLTAGVMLVAGSVKRQWEHWHLLFKNSQTRISSRS